MGGKKGHYFIKDWRIRVEYPPPRRSPLYKMPVSNNAWMVCNGSYKDSEGDDVEGVPVVGLAEANTGLRIEFFTEKEAHMVKKHLPDIIKEIERLQGFHAELTERAKHSEMT